MLMFRADEAGYEVLKGTEASKLPSMLYNEKAYVTSKDYIKRALETPPQGMEYTVDWLYLREEGPNLLHRIVSDSMRLLETSNSASDEQTLKGRGAVGLMNLSSGALVLLRSLDYLKERLRLRQEKMTSPGDEIDSMALEE